MLKNCANCGSSFSITQEDLAFYDKVSPIFNDKKYPVPPPTHCPTCRMQRRMAIRCERSFYTRTCSQCGKKIVSMHHADTPFPVYCPDCWWGSSWDAVEYGKEVTFDKPFFKQWEELRNEVPALGMVIHHGENSDFSNYGSRLKNCYLLIAGDQAEDCLYGSYVWLSRDCVDCMNVIRCEQCYECIECEKCYNCLYSQKLDSCTDCILGYDLRSCKNCFGCVGLRNKSYCWFNEQLEKDEYIKRLSESNFTHNIIQDGYNKREPIRLRHPHKYAQLINCDNCTGDSLSDSNNCQDCYDSFDMEDCKYIINGPEKIKDCYDFTGVTTSELSMEGASVFQAMRLLFSERCWNGIYDIAYCSQCMNCNNCFGCVSLQNKEYCILNKQYTKDQYNELVPEIIELMKTHGEWGEFFPIVLSPFAYNETVAQEYIPLTKDEVEANGWQWKEKEDKLKNVEMIIPGERLPDRIEDIPDDILNWAIQSEKTGRPFRIVSQELAFYRRMNLPVPKLHPDERHNKRLEWRNPRKLWKRPCDKCGKEVESTYAPDRPEIVYCEECYLKEVY